MRMSCMIIILSDSFLFWDIYDNDKLNIAINKKIFIKK